MKVLVIVAILAFADSLPLNPPVVIPKILPQYPQNTPKAPKSITDYGYGKDGAFINHQQTFINNDKYKFDGTAYASKNFNDRTPLVTGGGLNLNHKPSASEFNVNAQHQRGLGTDLSASGQYNFLRSKDGRGKLGAYGEYNRHYGGQFGTSNPQFGYGIRGSWTF